MQMPVLTLAASWPGQPAREKRRSMGTKLSSTEISARAKQLIREAHPHTPKLVVLDLDYTIWPFWCDCYSQRDVDIAKLFPETREILDAIKESDIKLAIASRSPTPDVAKTFLKEIGILNGYFEGMVIVPYVNKDRKHFPDLRQKLGIEFEDMLFFDDEQLQYRVVGQLGVTSILVSTSTGFCLQSFQKGLQQFKRSKQ